MSNEREQQIPTRSNPFKALLRPLIALAALVVVVALVAGTWNDTGAATGEVPMRIFLVGWAAAAIVISVGAAFAGLVPRPVLPLAVQHLVMGVAIGLAVGTTDWTTLRLAGWWQLWWTVPLLLVYASLLISLRRSARTRP